VAAIVVTHDWLMAAANAVEAVCRQAPTVLVLDEACNGLGVRVACKLRVHLRQGMLQLPEHGTVSVRQRKFVRGGGFFLANRIIP
jgi:hypothetical protein